MKITIVTSVLVAFYLFTGLNGQFQKPEKAIQIITPINHTFHLELNDLKEILEADAIKDRNLVVFSIAGSFRKGKSFLLNFFIRYLDAKYKKHDISDWMGEMSNETELSGFKWRGGRKPETTGIWMWSEVYVHDFENGEKIAIILLDTQGIFDSRSSMKDCTVTFALSMMLSSVQCYNVMSNIEEDDLNHLGMFTEYARHLHEQSNEIPFQYLLFIVRDWPYADETGLGWNGQKVVDEVLSENDDQTPDMRLLRKRIKSSFNEISGYLMPYPGAIVARSRNFTGNLQQIEPDFKDSVKELIPSLLSPENLIVKKINGQKVRARDMVQYIESYVNIFNGNTLPEPKTIVQAIAEVSNLILQRDCLAFYESSMREVLNTTQSYYNSTELEAIHQQINNETISKFENQRKLGDDELIALHRQQIENSIQEKYQFFIQTNEDKHQLFIEQSSFYEKMTAELKLEFEQKICNAIENTDSDAVIQLYNASIDNTLATFDARKLNTNQMSSEFRDQLLFEMSTSRNSIVDKVKFYSRNLNLYNNLMKEATEHGYKNENELLLLHRNTKDAIVEKFISKRVGFVEHFTMCLQEKLERIIDENYNKLHKLNNEKRLEHIQNVYTHNDNLVRQLAGKFDSKMRWDIESTKSYIGADQFWNLYGRLHQDTMHEFYMNKIGGNESTHVENLEEKLENIKNQWLSINNAKKSNYITNELSKAGVFSVIGAILGGLVGGPAGAVLGATAAGAGSASYSVYRSY